MSQRSSLDRFAPRANVLWSGHDNLAEIRRRIGKRFGHRTKGYYRMARLNIRVIIIFCGLTKSSRARGARFTVINNAHNLLTDGKSRVTSGSR